MLTAFLKILAQNPKQRGLSFIGILLAIVITAVWIWRTQSNTESSKTKSAGNVEVVSAIAKLSDVSVRLSANGTVSARQTVEVRPQISATIKTVHIKEGRFVQQGDLLFTLDTRTESANLSKAQAQLSKSRADLVNAERNLERQRELFRQKYISQAAFDTAQNQVDGLRGQVEVDQAAVESSRVALSFGAIAAPIAGRTGGITIYPGSLVQPNGSALVSITQIDPINVSFSLPERELASIQHALAKGVVAVKAALEDPVSQTLTGRLAFVDNTVDTASGTIKLKAEFRNNDNRLWPGMFVTVMLAPQQLKAAITVPVQAVQSGPENKLVYKIGEDNKVTSIPVHVNLVQDGFAVVEGITPGSRVVVEGAQNLRPGSVIAESNPADSAQANSNGSGKKSKKKADKKSKPADPS